ncbi:UV-endonuclease [Actinomyces bovis]|uniref:Endonuclease III n=1 Tax=Actinomyces bovis TaxID=1658 RepID=A0ABY1VQK0_9ACTO|nr:endonuclease III [Actinomyces bovis]SPT54290.1 UV-endonuclease [Actinomyces bovis]VEG56373.1 UV-endonuclease [Actinomyces israelii]
MRGKSGKGRPAAKGSEAKADRACTVDDMLRQLYPAAHCALVHDGPFQLLVATVLSAQTTDARVNTITPTLFAKWPDAVALAGADRQELEGWLRPLGMQRTRAERLIGLAAGLVAEHAGQVPADREALTALPGVGRKTANVVLGNAFGVPAITVDTHVGRLSRRLGWTTKTDPLGAEKDIAALLPPERWTDGCHRLIEHGRAVCKARAPQCGLCAVLEAGLCPQVGV